MDNRFASSQSSRHNGRVAPSLKPNYTKSPARLLDHIIAFVIGVVAGFIILYTFYQVFIVAIIGGVLVGVVNIFVSSQRAIKKRLLKLRLQFFDLLEAMLVAMRAGNPPIKALESARNDLSLIYSDDSDIMRELDIIIRSFHHSIPLSELFNNFANRSGLEDVYSFASVYATIEGKSSRADEIIKDTQEIIMDKMQIEMEIETLMTAAKSEVTIMLFMPLIILQIINHMGAGFMDVIYTTASGRLIATFGLIMFFVSYYLAKKFSDINL